MMKINTVVVDDHPLITAAISNLLSESMHINIAGTYHSSASLMEGLKNGTPCDVLLLDIQLPDMSGDEIAAMVIKKYPAVKILIITSMVYTYYLKSLIQLGVSGFLLKTSSKESIINAITAIYNGGEYYDPALEERVRCTKLLLNHKTSPAFMLTKREQEILQLIAADYTSQDIANELFLSKRTVDTHRNNLLFKFDVKGSASLVKKAIELGFIK